jgi:hypothetical protein
MKFTGFDKPLMLGDPPYMGGFNRLNKEHLAASGGPGMYSIRVMYGELGNNEWLHKALMEVFAENPLKALEAVMKKYPHEVYEFDESHFVPSPD